MEGIYRIVTVLYSVSQMRPPEADLNAQLHSVIEFDIADGTKKTPRHIIWHKARIRLIVSHKKSVVAYMLHRCMDVAVQ